MRRIISRTRPTTKRATHSNNSKNHNTNKIHNKNKNENDKYYIKKNKQSNKSDNAKNHNTKKKGKAITITGTRTITKTRTIIIAMRIKRTSAMTRCQ